MAKHITYREEARKALERGFALQNAASIAGITLTTECIVAEQPEPKAKMSAGAGMEGGDFDY
jgi:chaperonin GroEL (HSP60 family)